MTVIDAVVTWVDDEDVRWRQSMLSYWEREFGDRPIPDYRYRDYGTLRYVFRGIERYMPYVRKIYLVTSGHVPSWLNLDDTRITVVTHGDIFPDERYLPTFSSAAIECCISHIEGLAEHFVYFNDDMLVLSPAPESRFFINGLPCDQFRLRPPYLPDREYSLHCHYLNFLINQAYGPRKRRCVLRQMRKVFNTSLSFKQNYYNALLTLLNTFNLGFSHGPSAHLRSNHTFVKKQFSDAFTATLEQRFRKVECVSQELFRATAMMEGAFHPTSMADLKFMGVEDKHHFWQMLETVSTSRPRFLCVNDSKRTSIDSFQKIKPKLLEVLERLLPHPASFER